LSATFQGADQANAPVLAHQRMLRQFVQPRLEHRRHFPHMLDDLVA
jgi:hypothetical protein